MTSYTQTILSLAAGSLILTGCSIPYIYEGSPAPSTTEAAFLYKGINFGANRDADFKKGVIDGCTTASGKYRKDHNSFNSSTSYRTGWESGRLKCKG